MKTETQVVTEICTFLHRNNYFFWRSNNIPAMGRSGFRALPKYTPRGLPDICIVVAGQFYGVEVKRAASDDREPNGRKVRQGSLTPEQAEWGIRCEMAGGKYFMARSLEEFAAFFNTMLETA